MADSLPPAYLEVHPPARKQFNHPRRDPLSGVFVVHTAESVMDTLGPDTGAENVAEWISNRTEAPGSYHDISDADSTVHVVDYDDEAYQDGTGSNRHAIGGSFACRVTDWAKMSPERKAAFIENGAKAFARAARHVYERTGIVVPAKRITKAQSDAKVPGFISHAERDPARRSDPGNGENQFPWDLLLARYAFHTRDLGNTAPTNPEEFTMDAEAREAFDELRREVGEIRAGQLVHIDENRKQYGSLRGWVAAIAEAIGPLLKPVKSFAAMRSRAGELDTYVNKPEK